MSSWTRHLFGISAKATSFTGRGFRGGSNGGRERIELIGRTFAGGYHAALGERSLKGLEAVLETGPGSLRGFAYEGAAMGLALRDFLTPWRRDRTRAFLAGAGSQHAYMVYVGVGWLMAKTGCRLDWILPQPDPVLRWLAYDGWGFHHGYFRWSEFLDGRPAPGRLKGYARRAFDQGLGRSLWFIESTEVDRIAPTIHRLAPERHADLWSGVGLAATYAGEVDDTALERLKNSAGEHGAQLAQGAAFAAKARQRAGNLLPYTERACRVLCGRSAREAARLTDDALENLPADGEIPAYEVWRSRVQSQLAVPAMSIR